MLMADHGLSKGIRLLAVSMLLAGRYLPRIREADLMRWCWTLGIPLALLNIIVVGLLVLVVP